MAENIARLSVMLTANAAPLDKSITDATTRMQQFAGLANSIKAGGVSGIVSSLGAIGGLNLSRPLEGVLNVASHLPGPIGAIAGAVSHALPALQGLWEASKALLDVGRENMKQLAQIEKRYALVGTAAAGM